MDRHNVIFFTLPFHCLLSYYLQEVASASKGDAKFREALKDPQYTRIREALYGAMANPSSDETSDTSIMIEEQNNNAAAPEDTIANEITECDDSNIDSEAKDVEAKEENVVNEIEERDSDGRESLDEEGREKSPDTLTTEITEEEVRIDKMEVEVKRGDEVTKRVGYDIESKVTISRDVRQALGTLEKAINMIREYNNNNNISPGKNRYEVKTEEHLLNFEDDEMRIKEETFAESSKLESADLTSHAPRNNNSR